MKPILLAKLKHRLKLNRGLAFFFWKEFSSLTPLFLFPLSLSSCFTSKNFNFVNSPVVDSEVLDKDLITDKSLQFEIINSEKEILFNNLDRFLSYITRFAVLLKSSIKNLDEKLRHTLESKAFAFFKLVNELSKEINDLKSFKKITNKNQLEIQKNSLLKDNYQLKTIFIEIIDRISVIKDRQQINSVLLTEISELLFLFGSLVIAKFSEPILFLQPLALAWNQLVKTELRGLNNSDFNLPSHLTYFKNFSFENLEDNLDFENIKSLTNVFSNNPLIAFNIDFLPNVSIQDYLIFFNQVGDLIFQNLEKEKDFQNSLKSGLVILIASTLKLYQDITNFRGKLELFLPIAKPTISEIKTNFKNIVLNFEKRKFYANLTPDFNKFSEVFQAYSGLGQVLSKFLEEMDSAFDNLDPTIRQEKLPLFDFEKDLVKFKDYQDLIKKTPFFKEKNQKQSQNIIILYKGFSLKLRQLINFLDYEKPSSLYANFKDLSESLEYLNRIKLTTIQEYLFLEKELVKNFERFSNLADSFYKNFERFNYLFIDIIRDLFLLVNSISWLVTKTKNLDSIKTISKNFNQLFDENFKNLYSFFAKLLSIPDLKESQEESNFKFNRGLHLWLKDLKETLFAVKIISTGGGLFLWNILEKG